jgi:hypothetical protein
MDAVTTLANTVLKYAPRLACTFKIAHMEGEDIFGSCKWKENLTSRSKGNSHRHDGVRFFHLHVNHIITRLGVENEQHGVNQI